MTDRRMLVLDVARPEDIASTALDVEGPFVCLLAWDTTDVPAAEIATVADRLLAAGCAYICTWGPDCERVHDLFDEVLCERSPDDPCVISTSHADESLDEAMWFLLFAAHPDPGLADACETAVGISIGNPSWATAIRIAMEDPSGFSSRVVDEESLLQRTVVAPLSAKLGDVLEAVTYRCLRHEAEASELGAPDFYFGGELLLVFETGPLFISWQENAGWRTHFSISASQSSIFRPNAAMEAFDAARLELWAPCVDARLSSARVLGWDDVPYVVELAFQGTTVAVCVGRQTRLGDGDDLFVRDARLLSEAERPLQTLWSSPPTTLNPASS